MKAKPRTHHRLGRLAARQHGVVTRRQMLTIGYSTEAIKLAARTGRILRLHRGVYAVGHDNLSDQGRCIAAVAACGQMALLSHASAAWLWGLLPSCPRTPQVSVPHRGHRRRGIHLHFAPALAAADRAELEKIPVTALPRTLLDLAACVSANRLTKAIEAAERRQLFDLRGIDELLARTRGHAGRGRLQGALRGYGEPGFTRSNLERDFLRLLDEAGFPRPATNLFVAGYELDVYWERERFAVELDTYEFHGGRLAFERDRLRREDLKLAGIELTQVTGPRLDREPAAVIERVRALLAQRRRQLDIDDAEQGAGAAANGVRRTRRGGGQRGQ